MKKWQKNIIGWADENLKISNYNSFLKIFEMFKLANVNICSKHQQTASLFALQVME